MTKTGTYTYKATIRLKSTGRAGPVAFRVWGMDTKGGSSSRRRHRSRCTEPDRAAGPHRTAPDYTVLPLTGTIEP